MWSEAAATFLLGHNRRTGEDGMVTLIRRGLDHHEPFRSIRIFPDDLSKYRFWRWYSLVALPHGMSIKAPKPPYVIPMTVPNKHHPNDVTTQPQQQPAAKAHAQNITPINYSMIIQVTLLTQNHDMYILAHVHTIDGKTQRKIPGAGRNRDIFKQGIVRKILHGVAQKARELAAAPAPTRGPYKTIQFVVCGDFNMTQQLMQETCRTLDESVSALHVVGQNRDFIISSVPVMMCKNPLPIAHDGMHTAVSAHVPPTSEPSVWLPTSVASQPVRALLPPTPEEGAHAQRAWERSRELLKEIYKRTAESQRVEEADQKGDEEGQESNEAIEESKKAAEGAEEEEDKAAFANCSVYAAGISEYKGDHVAITYQVQGHQMAITVDGNHG